MPTLSSPWKPALRRTLIFALGCLTVLPILATERSPWLGTWAAQLGDYGIVAVRIDGRHDGVPSRAELWWLANAVRTADVRLDGDILTINVPDHKQVSGPGVGLRMTEQGTLRFTSAGALSVAFGPLYESTEFTRPADKYFWHQTTDFRARNGEYDKWHESGRLKPLPVTWPEEVSAPLMRLYAHNDHLLRRVLELPSLSESDLATAYAWSLDNPRWNESPTYTRRAIAQNPHAPVSMLTDLWNDPEDARLWIVAARNPRAPADWRAALVDRILKGPERTQSLATHGGEGPPELYLALLATRPSIRRQLAGNRKMPAAVYETLARDYPETLPDLLRNQAVPVSILETAASTANIGTQLILINNPALPPATRTRLVHQILAQATPSYFARFSHDRDATPEFLARCADDFAAHIREHVVKNPNTPEPLLLRLAEDPVRSVARSARESLRLRFRATYDSRKAAFSSLESKAEAVPLTQRFNDAVLAGDFAALGRLVEYHRERGELDGALAQSARTVVKDGFHPKVMDFFIANGYGANDGRLASLAGQCGDARWIDYFTRHGAFEGGKAAIAYRAALESQKPENLAVLIAARVDPNQSDGDSLTALHRAVILHDLPAIEALLSIGANPDIPDARQRTALEYAVTMKFIPAIGLLDQKGRHKALVRKFTKEFPPAPGSAFLGSWTNNKDGFSTVSVLLHGDGTGRLGGGVLSAILAWRETGPGQATAYLVDEKGQFAKKHSLTLRLNEAGDHLTLQPTTGETQQLIRFQMR